MVVNYNFTTLTCIHLGIIHNIWCPFTVLELMHNWVEFSFLNGGLVVSPLNCGIDLIY